MRAPFDKPGVIIPSQSDSLREVQRTLGALRDTDGLSVARQFLPLTGEDCSFNTPAAAESPEPPSPAGP